MNNNNLPQRQSIESIVKAVNVKERFEQVLGAKAAGFISSLVSITNNNKMLKEADPRSVIGAAMVAATLDLPINPQLALAHIVPYKNHKTGITSAQFQLGWRGYVQLGIRSSQYQTMNTTEIYEGELLCHNRITGEVKFNPDGKKSDKIIGYCAYFKLVTGFEKFLYMSMEEVKAHGRKYSKSFGDSKGKWQTDFDAMAKKTVLKMLLSRWGLLSIDMQHAVMADQGTVGTTNDGQPDYDGIEYEDGNTIEAEGVEVAPESEPISPTQQQFEAAQAAAQEAAAAAQTAGKEEFNQNEF